MDAVSVGGASSNNNLLDLLLFNGSTAVRRQHVIDGEGWNFAETAERLGWINSKFPSRLTTFGIGGRAVQAAMILRRGVRWTRVYPIPRRVRTKRGKFRINRAAKAFCHCWWRAGGLNGGAGGWLHAVLPSNVAATIRLLAAKDVIGIDTGDRRSGRSRASAFTGWTARIADLRALGIAVSTTPTVDWSRNVHRIHSEARFTPPPSGEAVDDLGQLLTSGDALDRSRDQLGQSMDRRAATARANAAMESERFRVEWDKLVGATP